MSKNINVPKLRFKDFSGDWEDKYTIDIAPLQRGFDLPVAQIKSGSYPVVFSNGILKTHIDYKAIAPGVVTGRSGTIGTVTYVTNNYWPHNTALWVTDFKGNDTKFIYYFYLNFNLDKYGTGSGVPTLNRNDVHCIKKSIPKKAEQEKIAAFLTYVDTRIEQLTKKESLLQQYKKGIMQKIFSQEIRFKADDGTDFPDWEEKKLGKITNKKSSNISANQLDENNGCYKIYGATGYLKSIDFFTEKEPFISIVKDGAGVGRVLLCDSESSVLGTLDIIKNNENINLYYVYCLLNRIKFEKYIVGSTIPHIYFKDYSSERVQVPCLAEQNKIAEFLSSIDNKIEQTNQQLTATKQFKKALLQQMFV